MLTTPSTTTKFKMSAFRRVKQTQNYIFYGKRAKTGLQYQIKQLPQQSMEILNSIMNQNTLIQGISSENIIVSCQKKQEIGSTSLSVQRAKKGLQGRKKKRFNKSLWTLQENIKYIKFLQENRQLFDSTKENRRLSKINKMISLAVGSRSPDQCRSHHQKMIKYHNTIEEIISHVYLLQTMFREDPGRRHQNQGKIPMRIRKRANKTEQESVTVQEEGQKDLWDVLCVMEDVFACSQQSILYL